MITRVYIDGYKSFKDFELEMKNLMVIFGPNASGKSNLLDALNLISKIVTEKNVKEAFKYHRGLPLESYYKQSDENEKNSHILNFEVDVKLSNSIINEIEKKIVEMRKGLQPKDKKIKKIREKNLRYILKLEIRPEGEVRIINENLIPIRRDGQIKKSRNAFLETKNNRIRLRMEGQARPSEYDIGLDHSIISEKPYLPY